MISAVMLALVSTNSVPAPLAEVYAPPGEYVVDVWAEVDTEKPYYGYRLDLRWPDGASACSQVESARPRDRAVWFRCGLPIAEPSTLRLTVEPEVETATVTVSEAGVQLIPRASLAGEPPSPWVWRGGP